MGLAEADTGPEAGRGRTLVGAFHAEIGQVFKRIAVDTLRQAAQRALGERCIGFRFLHRGLSGAGRADQVDGVGQILLRLRIGVQRAFPECAVLV